MIATEKKPFSVKVICRFHFIRTRRRRREINDSERRPAVVSPGEKTTIQIFGRKRVLCMYEYQYVTRSFSRFRFCASIKPRMRVRCRLLAVTDKSNTL